MSISHQNPNWIRDRPRITPPTFPAIEPAYPELPTTSPALLGSRLLSHQRSLFSFILSGVDGRDRFRAVYYAYLIPSQPTPK